MFGRTKSQIALAKNERVSAYGYVRVSHHSQHNKGDSVELQTRRIEAYVELKRSSEEAVWANIDWKGCIGEPSAYSAFTKPLDQRPGGKRLMRALKPGDHVIFDKLDRGFRKLHDFVVSMESFVRRGIHVHFAAFMGCAFEIGTPLGDLIMHQQAVYAQFESALTGERTRRARAGLRARGLWQGAKVPIGCKIVGERKWNNTRRLVWRDHMRDLMVRIVDLHDNQGLGFHRIGKLLQEEFEANHPQHIDLPRYPTWKPWQWHMQRTCKLYWKELAWQDAGNPDPNEVNHEDVVEAYKRKIGRLAG